MAITASVVLGTVNFSGYLRVSCAKVSDPGTEVFVEYINTPVTNHTLVIPDLDPVNYYIDFRESPDDISLGTLRAQAFFNGLTGEWEYERRFYTIGALTGDITIDGTMKILTDPYLVNKNVTGVFKEGHRYLELGSEAVHDDAAGTVTVLNELSNDEKLIVEIKYNVGNSTTTVASGLFTATIQVTGATYTISASDKYKRFCLDCLGTKQTITLPALSSIATGDFVYLEHKRSGVQAQTKVVTAGTDKIFFNGLNLGSNELTELWVSKGKSLYLRKEGSFWEVIYDYDGERVGDRMSATFLSHPNWVPEDGRLMDGDDYPALYWWIRNVLPNTHYVTDNTVTSGGYAHPAGKEGMFVIHATDKKFRMPNTQGFVDKGLTDFDNYGTDAANRPIDYPGGTQADQNKAHGHRIQNGSGGASTNPLNSPVSGFSGMDASAGLIGSSTASSHWVEASGGTEVRVKNNGVIFHRHI
jgi:hypothetical protein